MDSPRGSDAPFVIAVIDGKEADFAKIAAAVKKVRTNPA
jgi:hypothetical protein